MLANEFQELGYKNIKLIDIANKLILKSNYPLYKVNLNFQPLPFKDNSVDVLVANSVIEHLENPFHIIYEVGRILKGGGIFVITLPNIYSFRSRLKFLFYGDLEGYSYKNNHYSLYTKSTFTKSVLRYFKLEKTYYSQGFIRIIGGKKLRFSGNKTRGLFSSDIIYLLKKVMIK